MGLNLAKSNIKIFRLYIMFRGYSFICRGVFFIFVGIFSGR